MKVLVWHNEFGAVQLYQPPEHPDQVPASQGEPGTVASVDGHVWARAVADVTAQGYAVTWEEWALHLTRGLPYNNQYWTYEDVPDGLTAEDALEFVRQRDSRQAAEHRSAGPPEPAADPLTAAPSPTGLRSCTCSCTVWGGCVQIAGFGGGTTTAGQLRTAYCASSRRSGARTVSSTGSQPGYGAAILGLAGMNSCTTPPTMCLVRARCSKSFRSLMMTRGSRQGNPQRTPPVFQLRSARAAAILFISACTSVARSSQWPGNPCWCGHEPPTEGPSSSWIR